MAIGDFKDLKRITIADKALRDKAFNIAKNLKYDEYQRAIASLFHKYLLIKKLQLEQLKVKLFAMKIQQKNYPNQALGNQRKEMYTHLLWTIFGVQNLKDLDFFYMLLIYAQVIPLKDTK